VRQFAGRPFVLLGVCVGGIDAPQLEQMMEQAGLTWRSFVDEGDAVAGPIARAWNVSATPTFYLIDHQGVIRYKWTAPPSAHTLQTALEKLIAAAEQDASSPP
jgi:peroxiredoxin